MGENLMKQEQLNMQTVNNKPVNLAGKAMCLVSGLLLSAGVMACDMHGVGFGMYAKHSNTSYSSANTTAYNPVKILLRHPYFTNLTSGTEKTVEIQYSIPAQISDVTMTVTSTNGIELKSLDNLDLSDATGTVPVTFASGTPGRHQLVVKVNGQNGDKPVNQTRHISVMVK